MSIKPEKIITDNEKNITFTDYNNEKIAWRMYTAYIYHDNQVVTHPQYLEKVRTNNLYIESSGSDIKLLVKPANTIQLLGNVKMTNNLLVLGDSSLNNLEISQNLLVLEDASFLNNVAISQNLDTSYVLTKDISISNILYLNNSKIVDSIGQTGFRKEVLTINSLGNIEWDDVSGIDNLNLYRNVSFGTVEISQNLIVNSNANFFNIVDISYLNINTALDISSKLYFRNSSVYDCCGNTGTVSQVLTKTLDGLEWKDISGTDNLTANRPAIFSHLEVTSDASFNQDVEISKNLIVLGDSSLNNLEISQNLVVLGDCSFIQDVEITQNLLVIRDSSFNQNVEISQNLLILGDSSFRQDVDIGRNLLVLGDTSFNNIEISQNLLVIGDSSFNNVEISQNLLVLEDASFLNNVEISNQLIVNSIKVDKLTIENTRENLITYSYIKSDNSIIVIDPANNESYLDNIGNSQGEVRIKGNLTVDGSNTIIHSTNVYVTNEYTSLSVSGDVDISKNLLVLGDSSFNQNVEISKNLLVLGDSSFSRDVEISQNLLVIGDSSFNRDVEISQNLLVIGDSSFNRNVEISQNLLVLGDSSFSRNVEISQNLIVLGDSSFSNIEISQNLIVLGDSNFSNVDISQNLIVLGDSSLNNVEISNNLLVLEKCTFRQDIDVGRNLLVLGDSSLSNVEISNNLLVLGDASFSNVDISQNLVVGENIYSNKLKLYPPDSIVNDETLYYLLGHNNNHDWVRKSYYSHIKQLNDNEERLHGDRIFANYINLVSSHNHSVSTSAQYSLVSRISGGWLYHDPNFYIQRISTNEYVLTGDRIYCKYFKLLNLHTISYDSNEHYLLTRDSTNGWVKDSASFYIKRTSNSRHELHGDEMHPRAIKLTGAHPMDSNATTMSRRHDILGRDSLEGEGWVRNSSHIYEQNQCLYLTGGVVGSPAAWWLGAHPNNPLYFSGQAAHWYYTTDNRTFSIIASNFIKAAGFFGTSDDRIKHNEIDISNNLHIIRQLKPKIYQKTTEMYPANYTGDISGSYTIELGLIAQDLLDISYFRFCVTEGDYIDSSGNLVEEKYSVNYNNIFVAHIAATQELDANVKLQQDTINIQQQNIEDLSNEIITMQTTITRQEQIIQNLTNENTIIKAALNRLLTDASYDLI